MAKRPKFDTSFNFGANRKPKKARKGNQKRGKGAAHGS
jgi:hypothetical protein